MAALSPKLGKTMERVVGIVLTVGWPIPSQSFTYLRNLILRDCT